MFYNNDGNNNLYWKRYRPSVFTSPNHTKILFYDGFTLRIKNLIKTPHQSVHIVVTSRESLWYTGQSLENTLVPDVFSGYPI